MKRKACSLVVVAVSLACIFLNHNDCEPAGYALIEQGVSGLGNAYADGAASAPDPTTIFYNPAGIMRYSTLKIIAAGYAIIPSARFTNHGSTHILQNRTWIPLLGDNGDDAGVTAFVPNLYFSLPMNDKVFISAGVYSPFGFIDKLWRYMGWKGLMVMQS